MFKIIHIPTLRVVKETPHDLKNLDDYVEARIVPDNKIDGSTYGTIYFDSIEEANKYIDQQSSYFIPNETLESIELFNKYFEITAMRDKINRRHFTVIETEDV